MHEFPEVSFDWLINGSGKLQPTVTNVTHDIGPGKFETSFKLTYAGNKIEAMRNQLVSAYVVLKGADSELV